jgi:membrane peptidoglycan carboxypeptidase
VQHGETIFTRTSVLGRLVTFAAIGGVLAAAMILPVVVASGVLVRNEADKFTTLSMNDQSLPQRSEILDRNGHLLAYVYGVDVSYYTSATNANKLQYFGWDRQPLSYAQIAPSMVNALVAIEDSRYWLHGAIDLRGTIRAAVNDLQHKPVQGGSTIAQQYVKNVLLLEAEVANNSQAEQNADADTLNRKLNELRMAVAAEHQESKQDILDGYLNDAYFGNNAYGIEVAAETYFGTTAAKLTVTQAATLAGIVENPTRYDPLTDPAQALLRRNTVLARMWQTNNGLTKAQATIDEAKPLGVVKNAEPQSGCESSSVGTAGFFCQYVEEVFLRDPAYGKTPMDRAKLLSTGGLKIYTTLNPKDQSAANEAVNYVEPSHSGYFNPGKNADAEAMVQPGTGQIEAIAENRAYGTSSGQTEIDYAVNTAYGGSSGVQTGSSSKLFTLVTALNQGVPFGFQLTVPGSTTVTGYTSCKGAPAGYYQGTPGAYNVTNAEGPGGKSTDSLYTGTTNSVNVFYAELEKKVGLCNVVHTAVNLGMTRADGTSLLSADGGQDSADNIPSFTLGSVNVSPLSMAAAYATVASRGTYCSPVAIGKIVTGSGGKLAVPSANCRRALSYQVADAVNYILQGVLTTGTADNIGGLSGREAAGKTGTSNVASDNGTPYAAFAGYTPNLVGYVSVFNPISPTGDTMGGQNACYRLESGSQSCPGEMFGADAPGSTWHMSFDHAALGPVDYFVPVPIDSPFNSMGNGQVVVQPKPTKTKGGGGGKGNGGGNGNGGGGGNGGTGGTTGGPVNAALRRTGRA